MPRTVAKISVVALYHGCLKLGNGEGREKFLSGQEKISEFVFLESGKNDILRKNQGN